MSKKIAKFISTASSIIASLSLFSQKVSAQYYDWDYSSTSATDGGAWAVLTGMGLLCQIPMCIIGIASLAFTIWMIIDAAKRDESVLPGKIKWIILMVFTGWIGSLIYFFTRKKKMGK